MSEQAPFSITAWRTRLSLTQAQAAAALGVSLRGYQKREATGEVNAEAELACLYLEEHPEVLRRRIGADE